MIDVADLIAVTGATEADEPALQEMERNAVAFVQIQTDRYFGPPQEVTEWLTGHATRRLWLRDHVVVDEYGDPVVPVLVDERAYAGDAATAITDDGWSLRQSEREYQLVRLGDSVAWTSPYEYAVTYQRGYPAGEEPGDIRQLVLDLVSVRWSLLDAGAGALRSEAIGGYSYTRFGESDLDAVGGGWSTINAWRRPVFA